MAWLLRRVCGRQFGRSHGTDHSVGVGSAGPNFNDAVSGGAVLAGRPGLAVLTGHAAVPLAWVSERPMLRLPSVEARWRRSTGLVATRVRHVLALMFHVKHPR